MTEPQKGNTGLQFARPLPPDGDYVAKRAVLQSTLRPTPALALAALIVLSCSAFLVQPRPDGAQNLPSSIKASRAVQASKRIRLAMGDRTKGAEKSTDTARPGLSFYTKGVRGSMFSAPQPPKLQKPKEAPIPKPVKVIVPPLQPQFVPNPLADWTYAGSVTIGDKVMALLENRQTKEGQYVLAGQSFLGIAQVQSVTDQLVTLVSAGKPTILAKSDAINLTPLSANAAYLNGSGPQAAQGQPPAPGAPPGQAVGSGGAGMNLPNGRVLTPEQAARFNGRMNRRFNGGGRGGTRGGG